MDTKPQYINNKVIPTKDISKSVKAYVQYKGYDDETPILEQNQQIKIIAAHKRSLIDWRKLYNNIPKTPNKIQQEKVGNNMIRNVYTPVNDSHRNKTRWHSTRKTHRTAQEDVGQQTKGKISNLDSALLQNFYETQLFEDRKLRTTKIKRHYQKQHQIRPKSINFSRRDNYNVFKQKQQKKIKNMTQLCIRQKKKRKQNINQIMKSVCTDRYEKVKLKQKHFIRKQELNIQNLSLRQINVSGFRYAG